MVIRWLMHPWAGSCIIRLSETRPPNARLFWGVSKKNPRFIPNFQSHKHMKLLTHAYPNFIVFLVKSQYALVFHKIILLKHRIIIEFPFLRASFPSFSYWNHVQSPWLESHRTTDSSCQDHVIPPRLLFPVIRALAKVIPDPWGLIRLNLCPMENDVLHCFTHQKCEKWYVYSGFII